MAKAAKITASGGSPVPTTFSLSDSQTQLLTCDGSRNLMIQNDSDFRIAWGIGTLTRLPIQIAGYVIPGTSIVRDLNWIGTDNIIFIQSDTGGSITTGLFLAECW